MTCAQGLLRLLWGGARSWSATVLDTLYITMKTKLAVVPLMRRHKIFVAFMISSNPHGQTEEK